MTFEKTVEDPWIGRCVFKAESTQDGFLVRILSPKTKIKWNAEVVARNDGFEISLKPSGVEKAMCEVGCAQIRINDFAEIAFVLTTQLDDNTMAELIKWIEDLSKKDKIKLLVVAGKISDELLEDLEYRKVGFYYVKP